MIIIIIINMLKYYKIKRFHVKYLSGCLFTYPVSWIGREYFTANAYILESKFSEPLF